jgi:hypothetical protein
MSFKPIIGPINPLNVFSSFSFLIELFPTKIVEPTLKLNPIDDVFENLLPSLFFISICLLPILNTNTYVLFSVI